MKLIIFFIALSAFLFVTQKSVEATYVNGYYKSNGTYVEPYYRSRGNAYTYDNYSYRGTSYSNGYGYNNSCSYPSTRSSNWYTPSFFDYGYNYGYNYNYGY